MLVTDTTASIIIFIILLSVAVVAIRTFRAIKGE